VDWRAPRGNSRDRNRSAGPFDRRAGGLRRELRAGQYAPHQQAFRLPSQPHACAGNSRPNFRARKSAAAIFRRRIPTNFSAIVATMRTDLADHPGSACAGNRHPNCAGEKRGRPCGDSRGNGRDAATRCNRKLIRFDPQWSCRARSGIKVPILSEIDVISPRLQTLELLRLNQNRAKPGEI
jgi:hypothetical protein